jgi:hypothetical protein
MDDEKRRIDGADLRHFLWASGTIAFFYLGAVLLTERKLTALYVILTIPLAMLLGAMVASVGAVGIWAASNRDPGFPRGILAAGAFLVACGTLVGFGGTPVIKALFWIHGEAIAD